jgi:pimeloyl-ACP methyl ester carboxylesterase
VSVRTTTRTTTVADTSFLLREEGSGDGTPVLLLHGMPETSSCWKRLLPRLAEGRRVLAPDLPGLGGSRYGGPYDVPSLVTQLAALVEAENGGRPVDVVGHDWGGSLALGLAGARPDLVRRLAVANAPYRTVPLLRAAHIPFFSLPLAPEALFRLGGRRAVRLMIGLGWRAATSLDAETLAEYEAAYSRPTTVRAMLGYYRAATRPRLAAALRREKPAGQPRVQADRMLVLWGARDPVLPISTGESVVRDLGPECVMVTVPGAGHFVIEEAPDVVADVLVDFLAEAGTPAHRAAAPPEGPEQHRVPAAPPAAGDLGDVPSVGPVPVGATPEEQAAAEPAAAEGTTTPAPAAKEPAAKEVAAAKKPAAKKTPAKSSATKKPAAKKPAKKSAAKTSARTTPSARPARPAPRKAPPSSGND